MREALAHTGDASRLRRNAAAAAAAAAALGLPPSCKGGWHCCEGGSWDAARLIGAGVARGRGEQGLDWDVMGILMNIILGLHADCRLLLRRVKLTFSIRPSPCHRSPQLLPHSHSAAAFSRPTLSKRHVSDASISPSVALPPSLQASRVPLPSAIELLIPLMYFAVSPEPNRK